MENQRKPSELILNFVSQGRQAAPTLIASDSSVANRYVILLLSHSCNKFRPIPMDRKSLVQDYKFYRKSDWQGGGGMEFICCTEVASDIRCRPNFHSACTLCVYPSECFATIEPSFYYCVHALCTHTHGIPHMHTMMLYQVLSQLLTWTV